MECCGQPMVKYIDDDVSCSCHLNAPCSKCTDDRMICEICGEINTPIYQKSTNMPAKVSWAFDKPIEKDGVTYKIERSGAWTVAKGIYASGKTQNEIKNILGTFDKYSLFKFRHFANNKFVASWCND